MNTAAIKRFLMLLSSTKGIEQARLYQLLQAAERCYCLKSYRGQYEIGKTLEELPHPFNLIGHYYQSPYLYSQGDLERVLEALENVQSVPGYKHKSLLTLGGIQEREGNFDEAMKARLEASKSESVTIVLDAALGITALLGRMGKNREAIEYLEGLLSLLSKLGATPLYFDVLNSYAVELAEVGKVDEASRIIAPVVRSPYTAFYPNWLETEKEIREKSSKKSILTFNRSNVIAFPVRETEESEEPEEPTEPIASFPSYPYHDYIVEEFNVQDKVEEWVYGSMEPNDLGTLMIAIAESNDATERSMIVEEVIDSTFPHTHEAKEAKRLWREGIIAKIRNETGSND